MLYDKSKKEGIYRLEMMSIEPSSADHKQQCCDGAAEVVPLSLSSRPQASGARDNNNNEPNNRKIDINQNHLLLAAEQEGATSGCCDASNSSCSFLLDSLANANDDEDCFHSLKSSTGQLLQQHSVVEPNNESSNTSQENHKNVTLSIARPHTIDATAQIQSAAAQNKAQEARSSDAAFASHNLTPTPPVSPQRAFHPTVSQANFTNSAVSTWINANQAYQPQQFTPLHPTMVSNHHQQQQQMQLLSALQQQQQQQQQHQHQQFVYPPNIAGMMIPQQFYHPNMGICHPGARMPGQAIVGNSAPMMIPISFQQALLLHQQQQQASTSKSYPAQQQQQSLPIMMPMMSNFSHARFLPAAFNGSVQQQIFPSSSFAAATNAEPHDDRKLRELIDAAGMNTVILSGGQNDAGGPTASAQTYVMNTTTSHNGAIVVQPALVLAAPSAATVSQQQNQQQSSSTASSSQRQFQYSYDTLCSLDGRSRSKKRADSLRRAAAAASSGDLIEDDRLSGDGTLGDSDENQDNMPRYSCTECGKSYATSSNLSRHKQTHRSLDSNSARKCPKCDKVYVSMPALSMHMMTHNMVHECTVCNKKFSRPWLLQGHLRSHTGEKPFGCAQCKKSFADRSNLRAHMQTHGQDKKFKCKYCGKCFNLKSYLSKHYEVSCTKKPGGAAVKKERGSASHSSSSSSSGAIGGDGIASSLGSEISLTASENCATNQSATAEPSTEDLTKDDAEVSIELPAHSEDAKTIEDANIKQEELEAHNETLPIMQTDSSCSAAASKRRSSKSNKIQKVKNQPNDAEKNQNITKLLSTFHRRNQQTDDDDEENEADNDDSMSSALIQQAESFSMPANMSPSSYRIAADGEVVFFPIANNVSAESAVTTKTEPESDAVVVSENIIITTSNDVSEEAAPARQLPSTFNLVASPQQSKSSHLASTSAPSANSAVPPLLQKRKRGRPRKNPDDPSTSTKKRAKPAVSKRGSLLPQSALNGASSSSTQLPPPSQKLLLLQQQQQPSNTSFTHPRFLTQQHSMQLQHAFNLPSPSAARRSSSIENGQQHDVMLVRSNNSADNRHQFDSSTVLDYGQVAEASLAHDVSEYAHANVDGVVDAEDLRRAFPNAFAASSPYFTPTSNQSEQQSTSPSSTIASKRHRLSSTDDSHLFVLGKKPTATSVSRTFSSDQQRKPLTSHNADLSDASEAMSTLMGAASAVLLTHQLSNPKVVAGRDEEEDANDVTTTSEAVLVRADGGNNSGSSSGDGTGGDTGAAPLSAKRAKFRQAVEALLKAAEQLDNPF